MEAADKEQTLLNHMLDAEAAGYKGLVFLYHSVSHHVIVHWTKNNLDKKTLADAEKSLVSTLDGNAADVSYDFYESVTTIDNQVEEIELPLPPAAFVPKPSAVSLLKGAVRDKGDQETKVTVLLEKAADPDDNISKVKVMTKPAAAGDDKTDNTPGDGSTKTELPDKAGGTLMPTLKQEHSYSSTPFVAKTVAILLPRRGRHFSAGNIVRSKTNITVRTHTPKPLKKKTFYECAVCNRKVAERQRKRHELSHLGEKPYDCSYCGKKFALKYVLGIHERIHRGEKNFKCTTCGKSFTQKVHLTNHEVTHLGKSVVCSVCGKGFASSRRLKKHEKVHSAQGKHPCATCGKLFVNKVSLKNHQSVHNPTFRKCSICDKVFRYPYMLKEHELLHTNERPYGCESCGKEFRTKKSLGKHEKTHVSLENPHQCSICEQWFNNKTLLTRHLQAHNQQNPEPSTLSY